MSRRPLLALLATLAAPSLFALAAPYANAPTCTTTWTAERVNGNDVWSDGDWADPDRWDNGVPTAADTACVVGPDDRSATFTVTSSQPREVGGLVVGSTRGNVNVNVRFDATMTVLGDGQLLGNDRIDGALTLGGTFTLDSGFLATRGGTVTVLGGGTLLVDRGDSGSNTNASQIGSRSSGSSPSTLVVGGRFEARESVTVQSELRVVAGVLAAVADDRSTQPVQTRVRFDNGGQIVAARLETEALSELFFDGAFTASGLIDGAADGETGFVRGGSLAVVGGGVQFSVGGTEGIGIAISQSGQNPEFVVTTDGGEIVNTGRVAFPSGPGGALRGVMVRNRGTLAIAAPVYLRDDSRIIIEEEGTLLYTSGFIYGNSFNDLGDARVVVRGRIVGAGTRASGGIYVPVDVEGTTVEAVTGSLRLARGGTMQNPTLIAAADAEVRLQGEWGVSGTVSGSSVESVGPGGFGVEVNVGLTLGEWRAVAPVTLAVEGGGFQFGTSANTFEVTGDAGGSFTATTPVHVVGNPTLRGVTLRIEDRLVSTRGRFRLEEGARIENGPDATATFNGGLSTGDGTGAFVNEGLVQSGPSGSSVSFNGLLDSRPGSELRVTNAPGRFNEFINLSQEDPASYGAGVTLSGRGIISYNFGTRLQGTVSPGTPEAPFDTLATSDLQFAETGGAPRLVVDVGPGVSDVVNTADAGILEPGGATLVIRVAEGFVPTPGTEWVVARRFSNNAPPTGAFPTVEVEGAPDGIAFVQDPDARGIILVRAVAAGLAVAASEPTIIEGASGAFVLTHPSSASGYTVQVETAGTATPFADYTLGAPGGVVRVRGGTTRTVVPVFARRDADAGEGAETVTLRIGTGAEATITLADGPSSTALAVSGIAPARGENAGTVTAALFGTALTEDATVRLVGPGGTVEARYVEVAASASGLGAVFDLEGAQPGTYDVVVEQGGQSAALPGAFEVAEARRVARIWAEVSGTPNPRRGRWSTYTVYLGNDTDADVHDVGLVLRITEGTEFEFMEGIRDLPDLPAEDQELAVEGIENVQVVPLWFPKLPASSVGSFRVRVLASVGTGEEVGVGYELYPPDDLNDFTWTGDIEDAIPDNYGRYMWSFGVYYEAFPPGGDAAPPVTVASRAPSGGAGCAPDASSKIPLNDSNLTDDQFDAIYNTGLRFNNYHGGMTAINGTSTSTQVQELGGFAMNNVLGNATRNAGFQNTVPVVNAVVTVYQFKQYGDKAQSILDDRRRDGSFPGGFGPATLTGPLAAWASTGAASAAVAGNDPNTAGGPGTGDACGTALGSFDPNDKLGPAGVGEARYYDPGNATTPYTIRFENLDAATAPAQEVVVVDTLDAAVFDLSTFAFGPISWGEDRRLIPPPGATSFEAEVDLSPGLPARLLVTASLDEETGRVAWHFVTLDPATGDLPEDAAVGFLPPNVTSPQGEGAVTFSVRVRDGLPSGAEVSNGAEIVFDVNEPIVTPVWTNTVDTEPPTSSVDAFDGPSEAPFTVRVSASDAGSGPSVYALYAQRDGGEFELAAVSNDPAFTFSPQEPGLYGFYSIAADALGNLEGEKTEAEATTTVAVDAEGGSDRPAALTLSTPFPNPTRSAVALRVGLPEPGRVRVAVYDALGREVAVALDGERGAGWHAVRWGGAGLAAGVYVVRVEAGGEARTQALTVVR